MNVCKQFATVSAFREAESHDALKSSSLDEEGV